MGFLSVARNATAIFAVAIFMAGCFETQPSYTVRKSVAVEKDLVTQFNMISTRNVDMGNSDYKLLRQYAGGSNKEVAESRATSMRGAVEQTIRGVLGGEFMTNVKIYSIPQRDRLGNIIQQYYVAEGDVWGILANTSEYYGFSVGDSVAWKEYSGNKYRQAEGVVKTLMNDKECLVRRQDGTDIVIEYTELIKL